MSPIRACVLSVLLIPALTVAAAEKVEKAEKSEKVQKMAPTKSNPPPVGTSGSFLIDKTIPAYGVLNQVPHYTDSRANSLYLEIHQVLADVESDVMSGGSSKQVSADVSKKKKDAPAATAAPAIGDARITELHTRLVELDARITYRTYLEQWHIDTSFSDLSRATEMLALSGRIGAATAEKVQATKPAAKPEAAPAPAAPAAPKAEAPAPAVEAPAPAVETPAPAAPPATEPPATEPPAAEPPAVEPPPVQ